VTVQPTKIPLLMENDVSVTGEGRRGTMAAVSSASPDVFHVNGCGTRFC
jgi:hypothetical protein